MSNRRELRDARRRAEYYAAELAAIEALPRRVGSRIAWANGVIWERVGDDAWEPRHDDGDDYGTYSSAHVTGVQFGIHEPTWERA